MVKRNKIALIGSGAIGGAIAQMCLERRLGDIILQDKIDNIARGKALDLIESSPIIGNDSHIQGGSDISQIENADVIIVTAGVPRKHGMKRDELIKINQHIIQQIGLHIARYASNAFVICITNPLDAMVWVLQQTSGLPTNMIVGMAGVLDSARFRYFLAQEFDVSISDVTALVIGSHGDNMVPLVRYSTVGGIPIPDLIHMGWSKEKRIEEIVERTKRGGGEIVDLMKTSSAYYAPAASAVQMAEAYLFDRRSILPTTAYVDGMYGLDGLYIGVPVIIGGAGVESIIEVTLNDKEKKEFNSSVLDIRNLIKIAHSFLIN